MNLLKAIDSTVYSFESHSLIFALLRPETDFPSLEVAHSSIFLDSPLCIIQLTQIWICLQVRRGKGSKLNKGKIFPVYSISWCYENSGFLMDENLMAVNFIFFACYFLSIFGHFRK